MINIEATMGLCSSTAEVDVKVPGAKDKQQNKNSGKGKPSSYRAHAERPPTPG